MALRRGTGYLLGVLAVAGGVGGCTGEESPEDAPPPVIAPGRPGEQAATIPPGEVSPVPQTPPNEADLDYIRGMIVHHQQALEMTALVPARGSDEQVRGLADRIADTQGPEIDMMNAWLRRHSQPTVDPSAPSGHSGHGHHGGHERMPGMASGAEMAALAKASGTEFDRMFLRLMITHHEGALTMAEQVRGTGADVRVQEMADDVTATQADEIRRMRQMLSDL